MPTDNKSISVADSCYERLKKYVLSFRGGGVISMPKLVDLYK